MKRIQIKEPVNFQDLKDDLPEDLISYVSQLKLLYGVPFSYLITDELMLPPESLRFFYIDNNWTEALVEGALSIGSVAPQEAASDKVMLQSSAPVAARRLRSVRLAKMHENHKKALQQSDMATASDIQSGFIMRSVLSTRMKGLEITGSNAGAPLEILRMESLFDDLFICIFDGDVTNLVIAEPKTGLRFGSPNDKRVINVRSIADDKSFGKNLPGKTVDLKAFTEKSGKLNIASLAQKFGEILNADIGSAQVAFELIATAHRAEFIKK